MKTNNEADKMKAFIPMIVAAIKDQGVADIPHLSARTVLSGLSALADVADATELYEAMSFVELLIDMYKSNHGSPTGNPSDLIIARMGEIGGKPYTMLPSVREHEGSPVLMYGWRLVNSGSDAYENLSIPCKGGSHALKLALRSGLGNNSKYVVATHTVAEEGALVDQVFTFPMAVMPDSMPAFAASVAASQPDYTLLRPLPSSDSSGSQDLPGFNEIPGLGTIQSCSRKIITAKNPDKDGYKRSYVVAQISVRFSDGTTRNYEGFISKGFAELFRPEPCVGKAITDSGIISGDGRYPKLVDLADMPDLQVVAVHKKTNTNGSSTWITYETIICGAGDPIALSIPVRSSHPLVTKLGICTPAQLAAISRDKPITLADGKWSLPFAVSLPKIEF
jgi:hypothetical protein